MTNILVTGGAGFLGSNLVKKLLDSQAEVFVVDNLSTGSLKHRSLVDEKHFFEMDIAGPNLTATLGNRNKFHFDEIYNLACPTGVPNIAPEKLGEQMLDACTIGMKNVLELTKIHRARFLHVSSSEVYGEPQVFPQNETYTGNVDPIGFRAPYEEGKRVSETLTKLFVTKYGVKGSIVRLFNVYGPGMSLQDTRFIPTFIRQGLAGEPITIQGDGEQKRSLCYASDLIAGLKLVMNKGHNGEVYNLGSKEEFSVLQCANLVLELLNSQSEIRFVPRPPHDHSARCPDLRKIQQLGWEPKISLREGLLTMIADFSERSRQPAIAD